MTNPQLEKHSINIVLIGYESLNSVEFDKKFEKICELPELEPFNFEKEEIKLIFKGEIPKSAMQGFIFPISKYIDKQNDFFVEYNDTENKLQVQDDSLEDASLFKTLIKTIVDEQASKLTAMGFNFIFKYKTNNSPNKILDTTAGVLKTAALPEKEFNPIGLTFTYKEQEYKKNFQINHHDDEISIMANYHFDKFKDTLSTRVIREAVNKEIEDQLEAFIEESQELARKIIGE